MGSSKRVKRSALSSDPSEPRLKPVDIPNSCDANAGPVAVPGAKKGEDIRAIAARYAAKLGLANKRLDERRKCENKIRSEYSKG